jgi:hypothetical protein
LSTLLVVTWLSGVAHAPPSTFYVDNTVTCDDETLDSSVIPYCTIQAAVDDASSGDVIDIGPGTCTTTVPTEVVYIVSKDLTLQGAGQGVTILDGEDGRIGIRVETASTVTISNLTVHRGYSTGSGGGLYSIGGSTLIATDATVSDATALASGAGAVAGPNSTIELHRVTIDGGDAQGANTGGGGISMSNGATAIVDQTSILNCVASHAEGKGGAIFHYDGILDITSTTISGNQAGTVGGGVAYMVGTLSGSTVTGNSAGNGAGLGGPGADPTVLNSIIAGNTATTDHPDCNAFASGGHNLTGDTTGCVITGDTTGNPLNQDPLLAPLADNGGPTKAHMIPESSPADDAGNPAAPDGTGNHCTANDQRGCDGDGDGGRCDIGAYELLLCGGSPVQIGAAAAMTFWWAPAETM